MTEFLLSQSNNEPDYPAYGWNGPVTSDVERVVTDMLDRGIVGSILDTEQYLAMEWLMEVTPGAGVTAIPPTKRGEALFIVLSQVRILLADETPSISEVRTAVKAVAEAATAIRAAKTSLFEVPETVKRFGYDALITQAVDQTHSNLEQRLFWLRKELNVLSAIAGAKDTKGIGRTKDWKSRQLLRVASRVYYNVTGYRPARNLPVRGFEGFLTRFCNGVSETDGTNWRRLAEEAIRDPQMAGDFIPFESVAQMRLALGLFPKMQIPENGKPK